MSHIFNQLKVTEFFVYSNASSVWNLNILKVNTFLTNKFNFAILFLAELNYQIFTLKLFLFITLKYLRFKGFWMNIKIFLKS